MLDLRVEHNQDTIEFVVIEAATSASAGNTCRQFLVKGKRLGGAVATFSVSKTGGRLYSDPLSIQVRVSNFLIFNVVLYR